MPPNRIARPIRVALHWFDTIMGGMREARAERRVAPDAPLPRPLNAYAGDYEHPGYGTPTMTVDGSLWTRTDPA